MNFNLPQRRRSNVLDQLAPNKENMPLQLESQPQQKLAKVVKQLTSPRSNWRTEDLKEAMDTIERRFMSLRKASRYWNIPLTSLSNHFIDKTTSIKCGPPKVLLVDEKATVVEWVFGIRECNLSISLHQLKLKVG